MLLDPSNLTRVPLGSELGSANDGSEVGDCANSNLFESIAAHAAINSNGVTANDSSGFHSPKEAFLFLNFLNFLDIVVCTYLEEHEQNSERLKLVQRQSNQ